MVGKHEAHPYYVMVFSNLSKIIYIEHIDLGGIMLAQHLHYFHAHKLGL